MASLEIEAASSYDDTAEAEPEGGVDYQKTEKMNSSYGTSDESFKTDDAKSIPVEFSWVPNFAESLSTSVGAVSYSEKLFRLRQYSGELVILITAGRGGAFFF